MKNTDIKVKEKKKILMPCCPSCGSTIVIFKPIGVGGECGNCGNRTPYGGLKYV